jgi:8-oxo-dGTP pyrophosphatase MutT (NUDIX family)
LNFVAPRRAARVVLIDESDAILLLSGREPGTPDAPRFWFVPGGGAEEGETIEQAARRELYEEVGTRVGDLGPVVWEGHKGFEFDGCWYDQWESFYVVRVRHFEPSPTALTDVERRASLSARWWLLRDLAHAQEVVYPAGLAELIGGWAANGPPENPVQIQ